MFGKLLIDILGAGVETIKIGGVVVTDTVKAPVRLADKLMDDNPDEGFLDDTTLAILEAKERLKD